MSSHLLWFRLPKGRVWHVAASGALVALCGQSIPARGERQPKRPPFGARPCPDCDAVMGEAERAMSAALVAFLPGDIRVNEIQAEVTPDLLQQDASEAGPKQEAAVDLVAALRASVEAAKARRAEVDES